MNTRFFLPAAFAALAAGSGLLAFSKQAEAQQQPTEGPRHFRFEFRNDGSGPRFFQNGRELSDLPKGIQDNPMAELLRRLMEGKGGEGAGGLEELFRQFEQNSPDGREPGPNRRNPNRGDRGGAPLNPQRLLEEMMRGMRGDNDGTLGFGPGTREEIPRTSKHHLSALAEWRPLVAAARQSTVRVIKDNRQVALATVVSPDGYALTKASEVEKGNFEVEFSDGRIVEAKVVDTMKAYDLALIKLEATGLTAAKFSDKETPVGTLIAAVSTDEDPTAIGVVSVPARSFDDRSKGFLGISMSRETAPPKGVLIGEVIEGGAAERAGMKAGDIILSINSEEIVHARQLQRLVAGLTPEQLVKVKIERDGKPQVMEFSLGNRAEAASFESRMFDQTALMGSSLSRNASGYPNALQSDLALQSSDAGGPVVDVSGAIVGLNIARSERVSTLLIPGKIVNAMLTDVQSGKFSLSKDADTLNTELREINSTIQKAQEMIEKAQAERDEALKNLERLQKK